MLVTVHISSYTYDHPILPLHILTQMTQMTCSRDVLVPHICFACQAQNWLKQMQEADPTDQCEDMGNIGTVFTALDVIHKGKTWLNIWDLVQCSSYLVPLCIHFVNLCHGQYLYCEWLWAVGRLWEVGHPGQQQTVAVWKFWKAGIQPDEVTYATVISALTKDRGSENFKQW